MNAAALVRSQLEIGRDMLLRAADDIADADFQTQLPGTFETPNWIFGHLAYNEGFFLEQLAGVARGLDEFEAPYFLDTSQPRPGCFDGYPSRDEVVEAFSTQRQRSIDLLDGLDTSDWTDPAPELFPRVFSTRGAVWGVLATHQHWHFGQLVTIRGLLGLPYFSP